MRRGNQRSVPVRQRFGHLRQRHLFLGDEFKIFGAAALFERNRGPWWREETVRAVLATPKVYEGTRNACLIRFDREANWVARSLSSLSVAHPITRSREAGRLEIRGHASGAMTTAKFKSYNTGFSFKISARHLGIMHKKFTRRLSNFKRV